jgi:electron transport complex protein RnfD
MSEKKFLNLSLRTSPHIGRTVTVDVIMRNVVYALLPVAAVGVYTFGLSVLLLLLTTTLSCLITERVVCHIQKEESTLRDYSAVITGLLLGLTLPPGFPLWMGAVGGVVSIALGKSLFGGLGFNVFNPALVGRAFLQASFPVAITTWSDAFRAERFLSPISTSLTLPFMKPVPDAISGATPLAAFKFDHQITPVVDLFLGGISGSAGETSAILILLSGLYLAYRRMLDWRIPVGIMLSVVLWSGLFYLVDSGSYPSPLFMLLSGGLMLGAWFMATDMVTSPVTPLGVWIFSALIGFLVVIIRVFGGLPEGVMYAILLANATTPLLHQWTQPKVYGTGGQRAS